MTQCAPMAVGETVYAVIHSTDPASMLGDPVGINAFEIVALVKAGAGGLEDVYRTTNHIDAPWTENPDVLWLSENPRKRSTSVGDIVVALTLQEMGDPAAGTEPLVAARAHQVASFGFEDLRTLLAKGWCRRSVSSARAAGLLPASVTTILDF